MQLRIQVQNPLRKRMLNYCNQETVDDKMSTDSIEIQLSGSNSPAKSLQLEVHLPEDFETNLRIN